MLIYQKVDPSDTTKLGFLPGMGPFLAETSASGGQDRGRTRGGWWRGHENPNEFSRSFDVVFLLRAYWKNTSHQHILPQKKTAGWNWGYTVYFPKVVERSVDWSLLLFCLWLFGVTSWFKCTRAERRTLYLYWIFQKSQDYGRWAVIKTLLLCCIWGFIILPSYNIGTSESLADIIHSYHLSGDQFNPGEAWAYDHIHPDEKVEVPTHLSSDPKFWQFGVHKGIGTTQVFQGW